MVVTCAEFRKFLVIQACDFPLKGKHMINCPCSREAHCDIYEQRDARQTRRFTASIVLRNGWLPHDRAIFAEHKLRYLWSLQRGS